MHTEGSEDLYMKRLDAPKAWFQANADRILDNYGQEHNIQKEDLMLGESGRHLCFDRFNVLCSDQSASGPELCSFRLS